jgi:hypothetical protein
MTLLNAIDIIEGLEDATTEQELEAWSYIGKTQAYLHLQGFYGRTLYRIVEAGYLDRNFNIIMENDDAELVR